MRETVRVIEREIGGGGGMGNVPEERERKMKSVKMMQRNFERARELKRERKRKRERRIKRRIN